MLTRKNAGLISAGILIGVGLGVLILAIWMGSDWLKAQKLNRVPDPVANNPAPDFWLKNLKGETVKLSDYEGRPVLVNFWATWCGPCQIEMPLIQKYHEKYDDKLVVLAVDDAEPQKDVEKFVSEYGLTFQVLMDPNHYTEDLYRVRAFPTTFFINQDGMIRNQHIGQLEETQLVQYLAQIGVGK